MDAQKLQLKIFVTPESAQAVRLDAFIGIFHRWIKDHVLPELVVDVANYAHVPEGPGVVLIGHESDYFMDEGEGRLGFMHSRKRAGPPPAERLHDLARRTFYAARLLEQDPLAVRGSSLRDERIAFSNQRSARRTGHRRDVPNGPTGVGVVGRPGLRRILWGIAIGRPRGPAGRAGDEPDEPIAADPARSGGRTPRNARDFRLAGARRPEREHGPAVWRAAVGPLGVSLRIPRGLV